MEGAHYRYTPLPEAVRSREAVEDAPVPPQQVWPGYLFGRAVHEVPVVHPLSVPHVELVYAFPSRFVGAAVLLHKDEEGDQSVLMHLALEEHPGVPERQAQVHLDHFPHVRDAYAEEDVPLAIFPLPGL